MNKIKLYGGMTAALFLLVMGITLASRAFAGESEIQKIQNRITLLQMQIEENKEEYLGISDTVKGDRARCDLATAKETQLAKLNGSNTAKRTEIEILSNLLQDGDAAVHLPKP